MKPVTILSRLGEQKGVTSGSVAAFDRVPDEGTSPVRHYVLLDSGIKLMYEPWVQSGQGIPRYWYVDLVWIDQPSESIIELTDLYVDIWVSEDGARYEVMDFDEFGAALADGNVTAKQATTALIRFQQFVDNHINYGGRDFPPASIRPFMTGDLDDLVVES